MGTMSIMYLDVRNYFQKYKLTFDIPSLFYLPAMYTEMKNYDRKHLT